MVIILPQGGQLQNYLKLDLGELENYLWAHVESKILKKKKKKKKKKNLPGNIRARMARNWTVLTIGRLAYHAFIHHFISSYAVLLSFFFFRLILNDSPAGKFIPDRGDLLLRQRRHVLLKVGLKSSFFFNTFGYSGQSVTASDFGSNGPRFESGRGRCVESLDKALYSHCPKEKPSH